MAPIPSAVSEARPPVRAGVELDLALLKSELASQPVRASPGCIGDVSQPPAPLYQRRLSHFSSGIFFAISGVMIGTLLRQPSGQRGKGWRVNLTCDSNDASSSSRAGPVSEFISLTAKFECTFACAYRELPYRPGDYPGRTGGPFQESSGCRPQSIDARDGSLICAVEVTFRKSWPPLSNGGQGTLIKRRAR